MKIKPNKEHLELMSKDPGKWKGPFYVNRKDPRIIVRKQNPKMGVTFNFGNIWTFVALICIILAIVAYTYFLK